MKERIGTVVELYSTQAKVRITDSSNQQLVDAWNNVSAKVGNKVNVEERDVNAKKLLIISLSLPILAFFAGFLFGGNLANYLDQNVWWGRGIGGILWTLIALVYVIPLRKNLKGKDSYWVVSKVID